VDNFTGIVAAQVDLPEQVPGGAGNGCQWTGEKLQVFNLFDFKVMVTGQHLLPLFFNQDLVQQLFAVAAVALNAQILVALLAI
jgi:hypothetical protein